MFYLIDKPKHLSSFDVIRKLRKTLDTKKIGHTGTLDPLASGCLLIATENSTKLIPLLEKAFKRYRFTVDFTGKTPSFDMGTPVTPTDISFLKQKHIKEIEGFLEEQTTQIPPKYSALHIHGKRAYELARDGQEFEIQERQIEIQDVHIIENNLPISLSIELTISSGGYIRSLAPLLGEFLGVDGGYITELRRVKIFLPSGYEASEEETSTIEFPTIIPYEKIFPDIACIDIDVTRYEAIKNGKLIPVSDEEIYEEGKIVFLNYQKNFTSLCLCEGGYYKIIRNNV